MDSKRDKNRNNAQSAGQQCAAGQIRMSSPGKLGRDEVFHLLRSPIRRGIIRTLGENSELSFTELRKTFPDISVGTLYYHLDSLSQVVSQNVQKKYILTEEGKHLYSEILRSEETMLPVTGSIRQQPSRTGALQFTALSRFFADVSLRPAKYIFAPFIAFLVMTLVSFASHSVQILFFFVRVSGVPTYLFVTWSAGSIMGIFALLDALTLAIFRRKGGETGLLIITSIGLTPLVIYPVASLLANASIGPAQFARSPLDALFMILSQGATVLLISAGMSYAKGLRMDRTAIVCLLAIYMNILLLFGLGFIA